MSARDLTLTPPEGVAVTLKVASIGARLGAWLLDMLTINAALIAVLIVWYAVAGLGPAFATVAFLAGFFSRAPALFAQEMLWNGTTVGKRAFRIRVVAADGGALSAHAVATRNLTREAETVMPVAAVLTAPVGEDLLTGLIASVWLLIALGAPVINRRNRRLGDLFAGTVVVETPRPALLPDMGGAATGATAFSPEELDHYGAMELQVLEGALRAEASPSADEQLDRIARRVKARIRRPLRPDDPPAREFLSDFYAAQRKHLEARRVMGDIRADKTYAETVGTPPRP